MRASSLTASLGSTTFCRARLGSELHLTIFKIVQVTFGALVFLLQKLDDTTRHRCGTEMTKGGGAGLQVHDANLIGRLANGPYLSLHVEKLILCSGFAVHLSLISLLFKSNFVPISLNISTFYSTK